MRLLGNVLRAVGVLIAGGSGLCMAAFLPEALDSANPYQVDMATAIPTMGGIPFVIGVGLFFLGRHLVRKSERNGE